MNYYIISFHIVSGMDPIATLPSKRRSRDNTVNWNNCMICQKSDTKILNVPHKASPNGIKKFTDSALERIKYNDTEYVNVLDILQSHKISDICDDIVWHSKCYSDFTHKDHLARLKRRFQKNIFQNKEKIIVDEPNCATLKKAETRQQRVPVDWLKCIFCQTEISKSKPRNVECMNTSEKILNLSKKDDILRSRLAGVSDLIASEGKYHLKCYSKFVRQHNEVEVKGNEEDACFQATMEDLNKGLSKGDIYSIASVWERYCQLLADRNTPPGIYRSNRFKEKIQRYLGDKVEFVKPLSQKEPLLIVPSVAGDDAVREFLHNDEMSSLNENDVLTKATVQSADINTEILSWLFRVAVKVHADIKNTPGHSYIGGIDMCHAEQVVPQSLYLLLRLLCSGCMNDDDDDDDKNVIDEEQGFKSKLLSIAQDIVFLVSRGHKLTPKHIGIGMAVHQATRSKDLVQLLHDAGHSINYDTVLRFDTSIAQDALQRFVKNKNTIIPRNFLNVEMSGYVRYATDNIDINEETLDGKGTFHACQTAAFRRSSPEEKNEEINIKPTDCRSVTVPPEFHDIRHSNIGSMKPEPVFPISVKSEWYEPNEEEVVKAKCLDLSWILTRQKAELMQLEKTVPAWSGFNQCASHSAPPVSVVGHLPIINAVAHDYDTLLTVIINCQNMTKSLNQKYTVLSCDEQLYCKVQMLKWHHPEIRENLVIMLGGFHVQMTFTKVIGKHMEDSGLKEVWIESDVFGENTADNILKGKMWNRCFRAHKLTFEALWILLWPQIKSWANSSGQKIDDLMEKLTEILPKVSIALLIHIF